MIHDHEKDNANCHDRASEEENPKPSGSGLLPNDFIRSIIIEDLRNGKNAGKVRTRFPPEPNGWMHIGHSKAICINFGIASEASDGLCNLRFDDTNPLKESTDYVEAIKRDIRWLGYNWEDRLYFASDYFDRLYEYARVLIRKGKAYVDSLTADEIREYRGTLTEAGKDSPYRDRSVEENLDLFERMKAGEFEDGAHVLRAKIDMASPNINMRDPTIYRIRKVQHHRTGDAWCIYPMYDYTHCLSDSMEGITHSLCSLEFENHRPLYDWFLNELEVSCHPQQIEFARLNLNYTVVSKRKLIRLVQDGHVSGWDDPRMPTIAGLRRRGYSPSSIRNFNDRIGVAKRDSVVDIALLENSIREELNESAMRFMAVLRPLKVIIDNFPDDHVEELEVPNHPEDTSLGTRIVPFSKVLYIEQDDFREDPPRKFYRLSPGREVRLRYAFFVMCNSVVKDPATGEILEIHCTYDPETRGGDAPDGRKVKATLHWVSANHSKKAEVRLFDKLFTSPTPEEAPEGKDFTVFLNPGSREILSECRLEPELGNIDMDDRVQFERLGYFCLDSVDSKPEAPVFNRIVPLKDTWARIEQKTDAGKK